MIIRVWDEVGGAINKEIQFPSEAAQLNDGWLITVLGDAVWTRETGTEATTISKSASKNGFHIGLARFGRSKIAWVMVGPSSPEMDRLYNAMDSFWHDRDDHINVTLIQLMDHFLSL